MSTWNESRDGLPIVDYSTQYTGNENDTKVRKGKHAEGIDTTLFKKFLKKIQGLDFDIMFEIKDKEQSALKALKILEEQKRRKIDRPQILLAKK